MAQSKEVMDVMLPAGEALSMDPQDYDALERDFREARCYSKKVLAMQQHTGDIRRTVRT